MSASPPPPPASAASVAPPTVAATLPDAIAILSEIWNTNAAIPDNEYILERIHAYVKTQLPQAIKNYQTAHSERETRKKSLELLADEITETFLNKTKYFYCPASELYFTYNNQVRYSVIHEDEIHHRILCFTSAAPSTFGASADSVTISAPVSEASSASAAPSTFGASASSAGCPNERMNENTNESTTGAIASAIGRASTNTNTNIASVSVSASISTSTIKYKIKNKIIKSIQSRDILSSIPESRTIQHVIGQIYPALFRTRDHAKYFLTILGDVLLKKSAPLIYFIPPLAKEFIKDLGGECYGLFGSGSNAFATAFKFKYYEHQYKDCRIVDIHAPASSSSVSLSASSVSVSVSVAHHRPAHLRLSHMPELKSSTIDLFCVAAHYSHRFGSADGFLEHHCKTPEVASHAWFFRGRTEQQIISEFVDHSTEPASYENGITMPNMLYLWKLYLADFRLPSMIFAASLRSKLAEYAASVSASVSGEIFPNRTSRYLPVVSQFRRFWGEQCFINDAEIELEIDELSTLFNEYAGAAAAAAAASGSASDATLLGILRHFYPDVIIEDDKYILNVGCLLWDKKAEINEYLERFKTQCITHNLSFPQPLYNAYEYYCGKCYLAAKRRIASKRYFEKYFVEEYAEYLDENGMITIKWWVASPVSSPVSSPDYNGCAGSAPASPAL
jgi:hypothetical protein